MPTKEFFTKSILRDHRCSQCRKLLFRGLLLSGNLEIRCSRCKTDNIVQGVSSFPIKEGYYFIVFDYEGKIVDASASTTSILGYSRDELLHMQRGDLRSDINPADYEILRGLIMTGIGAPAFDTVHRTKSGEFLPVKLRVKVLTAEESKFALVIGKVLADEPAPPAENTGRWEFSVNPRGQFLYVSNPLSSQLGYRWIELIGKPLKGFLEVAGGVQDQETVDRLLNSERFFQLRNVRLLCRDGSSIALDLNFHPNEDDCQGFEGYDVAGTVPAA